MLVGDDKVISSLHIHADRCWDRENAITLRETRHYSKLGQGSCPLVSGNGCSVRINPTASTCREIISSRCGCICIQELAFSVKQT